MLTTAPPITVSGMELSFRRDMPGFRAARNSREGYRPSCQMPL